VAEAVARNAGGSLEPLRNGKGVQVKIPYSSSRDILVKVEEAGAGGRPNPYYRVAVTGKQTYTLEGVESDNKALTHIDLSPSSAVEILTIVQKILSGR
jgi:hypothetical protein